MVGRLERHGKLQVMLKLPTFGGTLTGAFWSISSRTPVTPCYVILKTLSPSPLHSSDITDRSIPQKQIPLQA